MDCNFDSQNLNTKLQYFIKAIFINNKPDTRSSNPAMFCSCL